MGLFDPNFSPINTNPEQGMGALDGNWGGAFSGIPGVNSAMKRGDNSYYLYRGTGGDRMRAKATVGQDGRVSVADWISDAPQSDGSFLRDMVLTGAAAYGGLSAGGFLGGGAGVGSGAGFVGEGVSSGVPAWDGAMGGSILEGGAAAGGASGGGLLNGVGGKALDFAMKNPRMVAGLLGGALGAGSSGEPEGYSGPMPTITRGGWQASVTPKYMPMTDVSKLVNWGK